MARRLVLGRTWALVALLCLPVSGSADDAPASPPIKTTYDVVYRTVGEQQLALDMAMPAQGEGPFPALLIIHGGAWRGGNKASHRDQLDRFARRGYVVVSPQYRFCPKETFPAQVHDVKAAVRWLKAHAEEYRVDPNRVGAMGFSAGGHLALMLGVTDPDDGMDPDHSDGPDSRVHAVVNFFGPTDLLADDIPEISKPLVRDFLGAPPHETAEQAKLASPLTHVTPDDPPVLTFQGTKDPLVPHTQAVKLADALSRVGVHGRVELLVGKGHGNDWGKDEIERVLQESERFLDRHLAPGR